MYAVYLLDTSFILYKNTTHTMYMYSRGMPYMHYYYLFSRPNRGEEQQVLYLYKKCMLHNMFVAVHTGAT